MFTGEAAGVTFAVVVTRRTVGHLGTPRRLVAVLATCHTNIQHVLSYCLQHLFIQTHSTKYPEISNYNAMCGPTYPYERLAS